MSEYAIKAENINKFYRLGMKEEIHDTLAASVWSWARQPLKNFNRLRRLNTFNIEEESEDVLRALNDISFEVKQGEVLGIIGRNGAGKSTLLKVLSRITLPTSGQVTVNGRMGTLLEVGTGFHPELTGRENIYMNGTILGMRKKEIDGKFDEIVDFSGIEKFIDTPIKRYSSGMKVRLAFSVAAHLEPEILIIDEVLAVGDVSFQKKCLGKMEEVAQKGRTVLFVSHNMAAVQTLCTRGIYLESGAVVADCGIHGAINHYLKTLEQLTEQDLAQREERKGEGKIKLKKVNIEAPRSEQAGTLVSGESCRFEFELTGTDPGLTFFFTIYDNLGQRIANFSSKALGSDDVSDSNLGARVICEMDTLFLRPGRYRLNTAIFTNQEMQDHLEGAALFDVVAGSYQGRPIDDAESYGSIFMPHRWQLPL